MFGQGDGQHQLRKGRRGLQALPRQGAAWVGLSTDRGAGSADRLSVRGTGGQGACAVHFDHGQSALRMRHGAAKQDTLEGRPCGERGDNACLRCVRTLGHDRPGRLPCLICWHGRSAVCMGHGAPVSGIAQREGVRFLMLHIGREHGYCTVSGEQGSCGLGHSVARVRRALGPALLSWTSCCACWTSWARSPRGTVELFQSVIGRRQSCLRPVPSCASLSC